MERKYEAFVARIAELDILRAHEFKTVVDGKTLANALGTKTGPWMKDALDVVMAYQLRNPDSTNANDAIAEVRDRRSRQNEGELTSSLVHHFLRLTIRPLFSRTKPSSVTEAGRKNTTTVLPRKVTVESMDDSINKPWKSEKEIHALDLLKWCVEALDRRLVEDVWPQVVPPCLTLIDDQEAVYKALGVELLTSVLKVTPSSLLKKTGLGEVFEEALMPCLAYIPPITPVEQSVPLLEVTYPALLQLGSVRYGNLDAPADLSRLRTKYLDTIVRKGVLYTYTHCNTFPSIVTTVLAHLVQLINALEIESVKHLKYVLPTLTEVLSHPLAKAQPEMLLVATRALQAVILNGWPRVMHHRAEILKGLTFCWLAIEDDDSEGIEDVRSKLKMTADMLRSAVSEQDFAADCRTLIEADLRLAPLLGGD